MIADMMNCCLWEYATIADFNFDESLCHYCGEKTH
jgi:hypothetical protein